MCTSRAVGANIIVFSSVSVKILDIVSLIDFYKKIL